jgi:hypothetical protein
MNNIVVTAITLMVMGIFFTINPAFAGDRVKVFEMAESGIIIEFKMTPEEIAAESAENIKQVALQEESKKNPGQRLNVYEMAESGQTFSFPMPAEEIAAKDAQNVNLAAIKTIKSEEPKRQVVIFELAESGVTIEFPVEISGKFVLEAVAEKNSSNEPKL